jgi:hypothetical protein
VCLAITDPAMAPRAQYCGKTNLWSLDASCVLPLQTLQRLGVPSFVAKQVCGGSTHRLFLRILPWCRESCPERLRGAKAPTFRSSRVPAPLLGRCIEAGGQAGCACVFRAKRMDGQCVATDLRAANYDIRTAQELLGHKGGDDHDALPPRPQPRRARCAKSG